jgi:integrase
VLDFHSLRGQHIMVNLIAGVPLPLVQKLARHSIPMLTSNYYYHPACQQITAQLEKLPAPPTVKLPTPKIKRHQ